MWDGRAPALGGAPDLSRTGKEGLEKMGTEMGNFPECGTSMLKPKNTPATLDELVNLSWR